jgi:hypothetical protein
MVMTRFVQTKTNFTAGEIARDLLGRGDLRAYDNGALKLRNLFIYPTGGVKRRAGTYYVATLPGYARLISYEFNTQQTYLLALSHLQLDVYDNGTLISTLAAPWTSVQLDQLNWTQSADTLLVVHPDVAPKRIYRNALGGWFISDWDYAKDATGNLTHQPFYRFAAADTTVSVSAGTGSITVTASAPSFSSGLVGSKLRIRGTECTVTAYTGPTTVTATVLGSIPGLTATLDWAEQTFSNLRGYPVSVAFHQDRLVIGGSRSLPNRLWLSRSGDLFNFNPGTGLDDDAIEFGILSDQVNAIRAVFSGRHLQVFTSGAEFMVTGDPLTPTSLQIKRQTRVGSMVDRTIPPVDVDGATLFAARSGQEIREFLYTDLEQAYQSTDLALLSRHIIATLVDQDFDKNRRLLFVVRADGKFATLTMFRAEQVAAWTLHETDGLVKQVCVVGGRVYLEVFRNSAHMIEEIDDALSLDCALVGTAGSPTTVWSGLSHLNGKTVKVVGNGIPQADRVVAGGSVTIASAATSVQIGLPFTHTIEPLPANLGGNSTPIHRLRLIRTMLRLENTQALTVDIGRGLRAVTLPGSGPPASYSGDLVLHAYGWKRDFDTSLWRIESNTPLNFTLLSITTELKVN